MHIYEIYIICILYLPFLNIYDNIATVCNNFVTFCTHSLTDKTVDSGSTDGGSIPLGYTQIRNGSEDKSK